jgi:glycogen(starch) synthase
MKIMMVNTLYAPYQIGGAEISVKMLCEELVRQGHQVRVVTLCDKKDRGFTVINGVEVVYLPLRNIYWPFTGKKKNFLQRILWHVLDNYNFLMKRSFRKEVISFEPDIIHTNNLSGFSVAVWSVAYSMGIKIVHTSRDYYLMHPNTTMHGKGKEMKPGAIPVLLWSFTKRIHSKKVSSYVGISFFIMDFHLKSFFFPGAESSYIYNPVSPRTHTCYATGGNEKRVGFIGRLTAEKGYDVFCRIIMSLKENGHNIQGIAAGDYNLADESGRLGDLARAANIIHMGKVSADAFFDSVDVVILPFQWREPFGRVIVESALANKCVLTNPVGGAKELINIIPSVKEITPENIDWALNVACEIQPEPEVIRLFDVKKIADEYIIIYDHVRKITPINGIV